MGKKREVGEDVRSGEEERGGGGCEGQARLVHCH